MSRLFGTDGVRGIANVDLTSELAYRLGQACVVFMGKSILIGKDTRLSSDMLEAALVAGITSAGGMALLAGIIPTPAVALLVRELRAVGGVAISASHNPPEYNGIKIFDAAGFKLPDEVEDEIEAFVTNGGLEGALERARAAGNDDAVMPIGDELGFAVHVDEASEIYIDHAVASINEQNIDFEGMTIAVDTAHGASSFTTPEALRRLKAHVVVINDDYDGSDINVDCGSTHLDALREFMQTCDADIGIAHDGDADRVMLLTQCGHEINGDIVEAVCALDMKERGKLLGNTVVTTVMGNLGLIHAMRNADIDVVQTKVGDRYVLEAMRKQGFVLGGEPSGHMILLEHNSTGDGLMTAVQFLAAVERSGKSVEEAIEVMKQFPQVLINVNVDDKDAVEENEQVIAAVKAAQDSLGNSGRVLLRPSGTEPLVRVMVEAYDEDVAQKHAEDIAQVVASVGGENK